VEMQVDVLRRHVEDPQKERSVGADLGHIQELLRQQIFELRMLMQQMKPVEFRPSQLLDHMADSVDRFRRDTGIAAQFVTSLEDVQMTSRAARELARILQEALVNIRKHSGATNVEVRFAAEEGCWKLVIVDNGRGFGFSGQFSLKELDASRRGPAIIRERVRSLGGDMVLRSSPERGSELQITFPQKVLTHA
jgi:two-component system nitrate/nitrite sensor histidine kinase NarX